MGAREGKILLYFIVSFRVDQVGRYLLACKNEETLRLPSCRERCDMSLRTNVSAHHAG